MIKLHSKKTTFRGLHSGEKCDKESNQLCPLDKVDVFLEACDKYYLGRSKRTSKRGILMKLYLNQTMDKLKLGCQSSGGICFGSGICNGVEVVGVVGSDSVSVSSDSIIPTQLLLQFTTLLCTKRRKRY